MRILLIGSGGREHALAWKLAASSHVEAVLAAPGSDGMAGEARCHPDVAAEDGAAIVALARREAVDWVLVGPEAPLAAGLADHLATAGIPCLGPTAAAARLETSKAFAKAFLARHAIPTAACEVFDDLAAAQRYVRRRGGACVVKADGLAAGKGVAVCADPDQAERALVEIMRERRFGAAGDRVLVEERLVGSEVSYYVLTDGRDLVSLGAARDYKRAADDDRGENTGGMGACAPPPAFGEALEKRILEEIAAPTLRGMAAEGHPYRGVLYIGLMIDAAGEPRVLEYNARFGDPETQALVLRTTGDLAPLLASAARGALDPSAAPPLAGAAVCVVLAARGYPRSPETGRPIRGLEALRGAADAVAFHAGTRRRPDGEFETAGGRVLGIAARGADVAAARRRAYAAVAEIHFEGQQLRRDIAAGIEAA